MPRTMKNRDFPAPQIQAGALFDPAGNSNRAKFHAGHCKSRHDCGLFKEHFVIRMPEDIHPHPSQFTCPRHVIPMAMGKPYCTQSQTVFRQNRPDLCGTIGRSVDQYRLVPSVLPKQIGICADRPQLHLSHHKFAHKKPISARPPKSQHQSNAKSFRLIESPLIFERCMPCQGSHHPFLHCHSRPNEDFSMTC